LQPDEQGPALARPDEPLGQRERLRVLEDADDDPVDREEQFRLEV
jgi:hypothetical protein